MVWAEREAGDRVFGGEKKNEEREVVRMRVWGCTSQLAKGVWAFLRDELAQTRL
jgi:hypothetical protein